MSQSDTFGYFYRWGVAKRQIWPKGHLRPPSLFLYCGQRATSGRAGATCPQSYRYLIGGGELSPRDIPSFVIEIYKRGGTVTHLKKEEP